MHDFLSLNKEERLSLIMRTANAMGISPVLIEKDFWVCWILKNLFSLDVREDLIFKGGTSLSKAFGIIQRLSEDIDITIDRRKLGYDPEQIKTGNKTTRHLEELTQRAKEYIDQHILVKLTKEFEVLQKTTWKLESDPEDHLSVRFYS
jgi:predicted nucleotidyltransferase component of viral defense system